MSFLIDTYGMPTDDELAMDGCVGALRYISHEDGKCVTRDQVDHIHSLGKVVVGNFEDGSHNAGGGYNQGFADAQFALNYWRSIGAPTGTAIYYSVDFAADETGEMAAVEAYFQGVRAVHDGTDYFVGGYGDDRVVADLLSKNLIDLGWQTSAWSNNVVNPNAVLWQHVYTQSWDRDDIQHDFYGAWTPLGVQKPDSSPNVTPLSEDDEDMPAFTLKPGEDVVLALAGSYKSLSLAVDQASSVRVAIGSQGGRAWRSGWTPAKDMVVYVAYGRRVSTALGANDEVLHLTNKGPAPVGVLIK